MNNVYYLPAITTDAPPAPPASMGVHARARGVWWRMRLVVAGIRLALRPGPGPLFAEDDAPVLDGRAEMIERVRSSRPARIIDFDAARARLRPVPAQ
jgi:hypothetical protein